MERHRQSLTGFVSLFVDPLCNLWHQSPTSAPSHHIWPELGPGVRSLVGIRDHAVNTSLGI